MVGEISTLLYFKQGLTEAVPLHGLQDREAGPSQQP